jgi:hypothetical protein
MEKERPYWDTRGIAENWRDSTAEQDIISYACTPHRKVYRYRYKVSPLPTVSFAASSRERYYIS